MVGQRAGPAQGWREGDPSPEHGDDTFRRFQAILPLDRCWTLEVTLRGYDFYGTSDATVRSEALNQLLNGLALYNSKDYSFTQVHPKRGKKLGITPCDLVVPTSDSVTPRWPGWDEEQKSETGKNLMWLAGVEVGLGEPITSSVVAQVEVQSATPDTDPLSWDNTLPGPAEGWFVDEYLPTDGSQGHRQFFAVVEHEGHWLLGVNLFGDIHAQATYDEALVELLTGITLFGQKPLKE